jgi:FkbM family methyltransferase
MRLSAQRAAPILTLSRQFQFRGKERLLRSLGLSLENRDLVPRGVSEVCCVGGIRIRTHDARDVMFRELWLHGYYQDDVLVALENLLKPGDVFWDVGANFGFMSLWIDLYFEGAVSTTAFEPNPRVAATLRRNLELNGARAVRVEEQCLSDRSGLVTFYTSVDHSWNATLLPSFARLYGEDIAIEVAATTIDSYASANGPPSAMKIDVEGAEHLVVAGGRGLLRSADIPLVVEYNTVAIKEAGLTPEGYLDLYRELGYRPYRMRNPRWGWSRWATLHETPHVVDIPPLCNLVMLKHPPPY